jgi:5-methylcytosine-specific restriction endonuclease McrA
MSKLDKLIAAHPLGCSPYDKLQFVNFDTHGIPLYTVAGIESPPTGAFEALGRAFAQYGGKCFYCPTKFKPQPLSNELTRAHRDHVIASSQGGSDLLHNLVIACGKCGRTKSNDPIHDFRPKSAKEYLDALNKHIAACLKPKPQN